MSDATRSVGQISLRGLLVTTTLIAVACAAMKQNNPVLTAAATNLHVAALLGALVTAIFSRGVTRAFSIGFFVSHLFFTVIEFTKIAGPLVRAMLAYELLSPNASNPIGMAGEGQAYMGMMVTAALYSYALGSLAAMIQSRSEGQKGESL